jgi:NAD(P)-dependent dehydrogenase (short-subunit alcohol dehydrogenase family)
VKNNFFWKKVAIVTGASSGIGRCTALELAKRGAFVALASRNEAALVQVADEIKRQGQNAIILPTDVTQRRQVERMVQGVLAQWGRIDILVSNAGEYIRVPILDLEPSDIQRSFDVNFFGGIHCIKAVLPSMLEQNAGHIVCVTSMDGKIGLPPDAPYVSAKFALTGFCEVLRQEVREHGISVTNVLPGRVDTPMIEQLQFLWISPKISAEKVALSIMDAIRKRKTMVILPFGARLLYYIDIFWPRLSDWLIRYLRLEGWRVTKNQQQ